MDVYVKETLYVIDYNNDIPDAELRNTIFVSDDHITAGYAYNVVVKEANTGYSDLTFSMPKTIIDPQTGKQVHNPKLDLLVPLVKLRYRRQVYYTGENEITVRVPEGYGEATGEKDVVYSPLFPNNLIEDYVMDYVVQPVDKKRNVLEVAINFTAMDYPRFTLSKKRVGLLIDNDTITKDEWSIVSPDHPMDRPGMIKYIPWDEDLSKIVILRTDFPEGADGDREYLQALNDMLEWNPMTTTTYPLTKEQVRRLKKRGDIWPYGFEATCFYWPIVETGRYEGVLYEEGGWIGFQGYDLLGLQLAGLDPDLHTENYAWHWTQIYKLKSYLTPNNAENYLRWILDGTAWSVGDVDKRMIPVYNPATGEPEPEVEYTAYLNLSGSNCYNAITSLAQNFQLYPMFDCLTRTVHLRLASGKNYGLVYRLGDNIKSDSTKADGEKVITKLYVSGGSDNVGSANINIGTATREYIQNLQGFYNNVNSLRRAERKGGWAIVDDQLTNFNTMVYTLDYYNNLSSEEVTVMPEPAIEILGNIYHYIGETTDDFTQDFYYKCVEKYDDKHTTVTYGWLDVTGVPYLKPVPSETHGLDTPNYWEAGPNRTVYYYDESAGVWQEGNCEDGSWTIRYPYHYDEEEETWTYETTKIDPISGAQAPWDPNDAMYIMSRSPYWTNYIMNLRWYYQNEWITKEQILKIYQYNLQINNLNKAFGDKYIEDRRATQTAYENAKNNYDLAQDGYQSTLYAMENKYYLTDGDFSSGYDYCFHVAPKDTYVKSDQKHYIKLFHCYGCGYTQGITMVEAEDLDNEHLIYNFDTDWPASTAAIANQIFAYTGTEPKGNDFFLPQHCYKCVLNEDDGQYVWIDVTNQFLDIDHCPNGECPEPTNVVNNEIEIPIFKSDKYSYDPLNYPYGTPTDKYKQIGWSNGYQYNPTLKGYYLRLVTALDKMDARERNVWDIHDYEQKISLVEPIKYKPYEPPEGSHLTALFDNYTYVIPEDNPTTQINEVYVRSTSGQIEVWNEAVAKYIKSYGLMLDYKIILDASIKHIEQLEDVYESWNQIVQQLYANIQNEFGDFIVEGNYQNQDQPYVEILFNEGLEASDKYSIPEVTYDLDVVDASGLIEYRRPMPMAMPTKYTCEYCGYVSYTMPRMACVKCGHFPMFRVEEHDIYNDLVRKLHSVGQIVPQAGDYITIYDEPMGFFGVPGLITEVDRYLDEPIKNSIRINTSYTNDEQLVGNIITATNTVLSNKDIYARTAYINADGTLDPNSIKDTLNTSRADISIVSTNGGVLLNGSGLRCIDPGNSTHAIKYTGTGIYKTTNLNNENGESEAVLWERLLGPDGINATYINSGTIDTSKLNIIAGSGSKIILDKFGLYVKDAAGASAHMTTFDIDRAKNEIGYTNKWGSDNNIASFIGVDNNNNPLIYTKGFLVAQEGSNIANWITSNKGFYHLTATNNYVCPTDGCNYSSSVSFTHCPRCGNDITPIHYNRDLWLSPEGMKGQVYDGTVRNYSLYANGNFGVTPDGILYATGAKIKGSGEFGGKITITDSGSSINNGTIGDWDITEDGLTKTNNNKLLVLSATGVGPYKVNGSEDKSDWAIYANGNFGVDTSGNLYASNAYIKGKIEATSGSIDSLTVKNCTMSNCHISAAQIDSGQIGSTQIADGAINTNKIAAKAITTEKLKVDSLGAITANIGSIESLQYNETGQYLVSAIYIGQGRITTGGNADTVSTLNADGLTVGGTEIRKYTISTGSLSTSGAVNTSTVQNTSGSLSLTAGSPSRSHASAKGSIYIFGGRSVTLYGNGADDLSAAVYAGCGKTDSGSNMPVVTTGGNYSSRSTKENIKEMTHEQYQDALSLLKHMKLYTYDYKYDLYENPSQYGFMLDDIEEEDKKHHFFDIKNLPAWVNGRRIDMNMDEKPEKGELINVKEYNRDAFTKYLLTCIKALQEEIEQIKKKA